MAFVVHPKYKLLRDLFKNHLVNAAEVFFRGQYEREMNEALSGVHLAEIYRLLDARALAATRDYVRITTAYRGTVSKRNRRALKKQDHGSTPAA